MAMFANQDAIQQRHDTNYIVTYGCPPSNGLPTKPTIAVPYFKFFNMQKNTDFIVTLPGNIIYLKGTDGKCETQVKVAQSLKLKWKKSGRAKEEVKNISYSDCTYTGTVDENNRRHGEGKLVFNTGTIYEGDFVRGVYEGKGKMTFASGSTYDGGWS